jgi:hypothetical protein
MRWLLAAPLALAPLCAQAQEHHERHHAAYYQNWVNKQDKGCCNNQDCGELREENERTTVDGVEVRIDGVWCPVKAWHYLKQGNAPDWSTSHVCVRRNYTGLNAATCDRLLCYQPKPGS